MRTSFRTLGVLGVAAAIASMLPTTAGAATARQDADAWAAYAQPAPWLAAGDDVQWYVSSQTITHGMVGKTLVMTATSPGTIDCANLGAGHPAGDGWVPVAPLASSTCTATTATERFRVTKDMVGHVLYLNGWSAVNADRTTITGTSRIAGKAQEVSVTAVRQDVPAPVGDLVLLGTWNQTNVYTSSAGGVNQVVVGDGSAAKNYELASGSVLHSGLRDHVVDMWIVRDSDRHVVEWHLDLLNGAITTRDDRALYNAQMGVGDGGMWVVPVSPYGPAVSFDVVDWAGVVRDSEPPVGGHGAVVPTGYVTGAAVAEDHFIQTYTLHLAPFDGRPVVRASFTGPDLVVTRDTTGITVTGTMGSPAVHQTCRIEAGYTAPRCS